MLRRRFNPEAHYAIQETQALADTSSITRKHLDIPYASLSPLQKLDIYLPDAVAAPLPVIVSIHGGAFMAWDKSDAQVMPMLAGLQRGYAVVAVNYRLSWEAIFPALIHDLKAAIRWIRAHTPEYPFDRDRIACWGLSAGGYLSSMLGVSAGIPELEDLSLGNPDRPSAVQAVVDWFGPKDFLKMDAQLTACGYPPVSGTEHGGADSPESLLLGNKLSEIPEVVKAANPATYIRDNAPPFLIQHGTNDPIVPVQQSIEFAAKLRQTIGQDRVALDLLEGGEHMDEMFETPENVARVLDFLDATLKDAGFHK